MYSGDELYGDDITCGILTGKTICRECQRPVRELEDGRCPKCLGEEGDKRVVRRRMAELHRRCANRYPWDRAWFEAQAERLEAES